MLSFRMMLPRLFSTPRTTPRFLLTGLLLVSTAAGSGCSGTSKQGEQPSWRTSTSSGSSPGFSHSQRIVFAPSGVAAIRYNEPAPVRAVPSPIENSIIHQIALLSAELGISPPVSDSRLDAAARDLAEVSPRVGTVAYRMVEFALQRHGIIEPSPHLVLMRTPTANQKAVLGELGERLSTILAQGNFSRVGIGVFHSGGEDGEDSETGESVIVLALQASSIETEPIPRTIAANRQVELVGRVLPPFLGPHLYLTRPNGTVETLHVKVNREGQFRAALSCAGHRGRQQVEVTASDQTGSTVLANFPIWCGAQPPSSLVVDVGGDDANQFTNANEAESRMIELVNRDRASHGLPPLIELARLGEVARAHSLDMLNTGIIGHISPNTGNASDRTKAAGIRSALVLENVARAYGLNEAQDGLMNSPGHRANILSAAATHLGVGIVLGKEVSDRREMFITQVFIRIPPVIDREQFSNQLATKLRAVRPLTKDDKLERMAMDFADRVAAGQSPEIVANRASRMLRKMGINYNGVSTLATAVADLAGFDAESALTDKTISYFGIGVSQGDHPEIGQQAIYIVILFGHR